MTPVPLHGEITKKTKKLTPIPCHNFVFLEKAEAIRKWPPVRWVAAAFFCCFLFARLFVACNVGSRCWLLFVALLIFCLTFFCLFPPFSGLKWRKAVAAVLGVGQLPEGLLLPCTQVGGQEWRFPPPARLRCIADCCVLLVVVVGGGGSGLWCRMLGLVVCCCFFCFSF